VSKKLEYKVMFILTSGS